MKNIIDICKDFGVEVPKEQHADFLKAVNGEYKTIAEYDKVQGKLTAATQRAETAEEALKGFDGIDPADVQRQLDEAKRKVQEAQDEAKKQLDERDFNDRLAKMITEAKGKNAKAITALLDVEKLRSSRNQETDIKAQLDELRTSTGYLFEDNGGAAHFTGPANNNSGEAKKPTVAELVAMSRDERRAVIAQNLKNKEN